MKPLIKVEFNVGQSGWFGEKEIGDRIKMAEEQAKLLESRGIVKILNKKKKAKDGE